MYIWIPNTVWEGTQHPPVLGRLDPEGFNMILAASIAWILRYCCRGNMAHQTISVYHRVCIVHIFVYDYIYMYFQEFPCSVFFKDFFHPTYNHRFDCDPFPTTARKFETAFLPDHNWLWVIFNPCKRRFAKQTFLGGNSYNFWRFKQPLQILHTWNSGSVQGLFVDT